MIAKVYFYIGIGVHIYKDKKEKITRNETGRFAQNNVYIRGP